MGYIEEQFELKEWNEGYPQKANEYRLTAISG